MRSSLGILRRFILAASFKRASRKSEPKRRSVAMHFSEADFRGSVDWEAFAKHSFRLAI